MLLENQGVTMKKYFTSKRVRELIKHLKIIEKYRGESYENDDDIGIAMQEIKVLIATSCHGDCVEWCSHCEQEQEINKVADPCPNCGETLVACNLCTGCQDDQKPYRGGCAGCENASHFDMDWFQVEPVGKN
jgi:hypothetical protein